MSGKSLQTSRAAGRWILFGLLVQPVAFLSQLAAAAEVVSCGGAAMAGGAQLMCSHMQAAAPTQFCTYSWALLTTAGSVSTVQGSFSLPPGASNQTVYQGSGFNSALTNPIVLCQGRKS